MRGKCPACGHQPACGFARVVLRSGRWKVKRFCNTAEHPCFAQTFLHAGMSPLYDEVTLG